MICKTINEALAAADRATKENLEGLYPSALRILAGNYRVFGKQIEELQQNAKLIEVLEGIIESGAARICFSDDETNEDDWGPIPQGFSIRIRSWKNIDYVAPTLRECILQDIANMEQFEQDED